MRYGSIGLCVAMLTTAVLASSEADAGGSGGRGGIVAPMRAAAGPAHPGPRGQASWRQGRFGSGYGRHAGRYGHGFYGGLPFDGLPRSIVVVREEAQEPSKPIDRNSFENMTIRMGIPRSPAPSPVIYRIEGSRDRPVARVIRIGEAESRQVPRTRYAHAETGALVLTVPRR